MGKEEKKEKGRKIKVPIMSRETVRCSLPDDLMAPRTVPTTAQQMPTRAIMTMNQRIDTVCVTVTPQHDLPLSSAYIDPLDLVSF